MAGILANSASKTMLAGATSADNTSSGYVALEEIALSTTPTGSSYRWSIAKPSGSTARAALSSTTDASPVFTPDLEGFYTITCVVDSVTTYVLRLSVAHIGEVATIDVVRLVPIQNVQVPTPATGRSIFSSSDLNDLAQKLPDGNTYPIGGGGGGGGGSGSGYYANIAALKAISSTLLATLDDGVTLAYVATLKSWFVWEAASTVADDTTDFLSVTVTANGVAAGRFRRLDWSHPSWLAQTAWYVSTSGSNENDGLTSLTPVKTDAEIQRRLGQGSVLSVQATVTYAQAPAGRTSFDVGLSTDASFTLVGTPTTAQTGLTISAVATQVRTAGAEVGWGITATGLGASDVGKLAIIRTSGTGSHVGAYARILKNLGSGAVRTSPFVTTNLSNYPPTTQITPSIGDVIDVIEPMTLQLGRVHVFGESNGALLGSPSRNALVIDSITLEGNADAFGAGSVAADNINAVYVRSILEGVTLSGNTDGIGALHYVCGGGVAGSLIAASQVVSLFKSSVLNGALFVQGGSVVGLDTDTYFQGSYLYVSNGGNAQTSGAAFFDSTITGTITIAPNASVHHLGAVPDWGTANTGRAILIRAGSTYTYQTKPTINSGLGAGREVLIGVTDKLYTAVPFHHPSTDAAIVDASGTDGSAGDFSSYANIATLKAMSSSRFATLQDGQRVYVVTLRAWFAWDATSTVADDTTDFLSVSVTTNGVAAGRFRRLDWSHPAWLAQAAWYVSTSGSNENDGATALTPVKTDAEIQRRWGIGKHARITAAVTITYAQAPSEISNLEFSVGESGSLTLVGTPTLTKSGTVITAVQTQVRTPGAEAGWAITGSGLGSSDVGKLARITASGTPANVGGYAPILKDETGGKVRVAPFLTFNSATGGATQVTPQVGDTIEVFQPMTLLVGCIDIYSAATSAPSSGLQRVLFDSISLDGGAAANGAIYTQKIPIYTARCGFNALKLYGTSEGSASAYLLRGGIIGTSGLDVRAPGVVILNTGCGSLGTVSVTRSGILSLGSDCYFQNCGLTVSTSGLASTGGAAFFDRSVSDSTFLVLTGGLVTGVGGVGDWGTNNAGHGILIAPGAPFVYFTKPTINSGLGAGREILVGGSDKLYSSVPYIEFANGAAIVKSDATASPDGPVLYYQSFVNIAALKAVTATRLANLQDGQRVYVVTLKAWFAWDATSTVADDTTDFLSVTVTANGVAAGRFRRLDDVHPAWMEQVTWVIDPANSTGLASNENLGDDVTRPLLNDAERQRRMGASPFWRLNEYHLRYISDVPVAQVVVINGNTRVGCNIYMHGSMTNSSGQSVLFGGAGTPAGTITALNYAAGSGGQPWEMICAAISGTWSNAGPGSTSLIDKRIRFTTGANAGGVVWAVKDLGGASPNAKARLNEPAVARTFSGNFSASINTFTPVAGDNFVVEKLTQIPNLVVDIVGIGSNPGSAFSTHVTFDSLDIGTGGRAVFQGSVRGLNFWGCTIGSIEFGSMVSTASFFGSQFTSANVPSFHSGSASNCYNNTSLTFNAVVSFSLTRHMSQAPAAGNAQVRFSGNRGRLSTGIVEGITISQFGSWDNASDYPLVVVDSAYVTPTGTLWGNGCTAGTKAAIALYHGARFEYGATSTALPASYFYLLAATSGAENGAFLVCLNNAGASRPSVPAYDDTANAFTAKRLLSAANLAATVATTGFDGYFFDPVTTCSMGQA